ncbi:tetratricopeptide repeat protein [Corynebacterium doosanense]|uniref:Thioredoxin n=1 Tax=Corynebacterium doosanense CAU 212 = DSM 45436 TaxID=558173 RepID=A0A097IFF1_9CORY|nr:tetratricopeptide repeat protein [Corynebacterium doosanense]AIT60862.1 thioredoxin [Corynebacterium doosanense CAU 212 = DSM 45436]
MTTPDRFAAGALDLGQLAAQPEPAAGADTAAFFTVTEANLEDLARRSMQVPVIILIGTDRAPESVQLRADFQELSAGQRQFLVGYVDADRSPAIAQALGVHALPSVIALAGGRPLADFQGGQPRENLQQWIGAILQAVEGKLEGLPAEEGEDEPAEDPRLTAALDKLNAGDFDGAIAVYDEILAEGNDPEIRQARATAVLLRRSGQEQPEEFAAADREVISGDPEAAFSRLIDLVRTTAGEERDAAKARLIELFGLFENSDPRVKSARTALASALY